MSLERPHDVLALSLAKIMEAEALPERDPQRARLYAEAQALATLGHAMCLGRMRA